MVGFKVGELQKIPGPDLFEQDAVFVVVEDDLEVFATADAVVVLAFQADEEVFPEVADRVISEVAG